MVPPALTNGLNAQGRKSAPRTSVEGMSGTAATKYDRRPDLTSSLLRPQIGFSRQTTQIRAQSGASSWLTHNWYAQLSSFRLLYETPCSLKADCMDESYSSHCFSRHLGQRSLECMKTDSRRDDEIEMRVSCHGEVINSPASKHDDLFRRDLGYKVSKHSDVGPVASLTFSLPGKRDWASVLDPLLPPSFKVASSVQIRVVMGDYLPTTAPTFSSDDLTKLRANQNKRADGQQQINVPCRNVVG